MKPILFTVGSLSITSFGFFLAISFLASIFIIWKLAKIYDINEEKVLDLALVSFVGGLLGARVFFILLNLEIFDTIEKIFLINRYPGLSFWGGLIGGTLTLRIFLKRTKLNFWQILDFASIGALLGIILGNIGCFLGGCGYGAVSDSLLALPVVGLVGKRFPVSLIESVLLFLAFIFLWKQVTRFHFTGKIISLFLILVGTIKYWAEFFRGNIKIIESLGGLSLSHFLSLLLVLMGTVIFYKRSKRSWIKDLKFIFNLPFSPKSRNALLLYLKKSCYNQKVNLKLRVERISQLLKDSPKVLKRRFNVKSTPTNLR